MPVHAYVPYPSVSVERAAKVLRISPKTIYRNLDDVPHIRIAGYIRVHVSFLMCEYVPPPEVKRVEQHYYQSDPLQLEFVYDVPIRTVKRFRNGEPRLPFHYEGALYAQRVPRKPQDGL